ncbi:MAG TPA: methyl-accepting chemotaxis protein [Polyangiaceae bacterium]
MRHERSDQRLYLGFGIAGVIIGLIFPVVAQFFVVFRDGMLTWFVITCIAAGLTMAIVAAVSVRVTIVQRLVDQEETEREKRRLLQDALHSYSAFAEQIGRGELTTRLGRESDKYGDEEVARLGHQLDTMATSLHDMSRQISKATDEMFGASATLLTTSAQQSSGAAEQAAAVAEITTTVEEVRQTADQAADRAQAVIGATEQAQRSYETGQRAVEGTIDGMSTLRDRVESIARSILDLSDKTQKIGEIVATVSELAEQSNLLAINAAIEAAKAGEQGRGFAVVATEVRNLAEQSKQATRQVRTIITEIQRATNSAVMVTEEGTKQADAGMSVAKETGETLALLSKIITESVQSARQIAALSRQQAIGIDQVSASMRNIQLASKDTAEGTRSTERSSRELRALADRMRELVTRYTI